MGIITNAQDLVDKYFSEKGHQFMAMSSGKINETELIAALINQCDSLVEGIQHAQEVINGSATILILTPEGIIAARDKLGRLPVLVGQNDDGYCVSFESFAYQKLGYHTAYELGPREIVKITAEGCESLVPAGDKMRICAFLWTYYGYPNSNYEGVNVEVMRYRNGEIMARDEVARGMLPKVDYVAGVPDSGVPHAIGFANRSGKPFARPFVKYTPTWPRSFMPVNQDVRNQVAKMKQIPVPELIKDKKLLLIDDSIVRGTTMTEIVRMAREAGAVKVFVASSAPRVMFPNVYGIDMPTKSELICGDGKDAEAVAKELGADKVIFQSIDGLKNALHDLNPAIPAFDCSCFDGRYVTGDITPEYLDALDAKAAAAKTAVKAAGADD